MAKKVEGKEAPIEKDVRRMRKSIKGARIAMFTTVASDGKLRSRPMANLKGGFDGDLWFLTRSSAPKAEEIRDNQHVNVAYSDCEDDRYVSISGTATLVRDPAKARSCGAGVCAIGSRTARRTRTSPSSACGSNARRCGTPRRRA